VLVEIPIALRLEGAERVAAAAAASDRVLALCHPMRFHPERAALRRRVMAGAEHVVQIAGRFFIHRFENVGATGYARSWTDNLLWHHFCHFVDMGLDLVGDVPIRRVESHYAALHPKTGTPMDAVVLVETEADQSLLVHGTYRAAFRLYDSLVVTDRDTYEDDILAATWRTRDGTTPMPSEQAICALVIDDFLDAIAEGRQPRAPAASVLPAMRVLQAVQDDWDARYGNQPIPGRELAG
jgi:2-hydroxy-4-carboxymuconate semialdehyde hemiacetal dehydrogenase